nr:reverse transcriptase domain-containing protein [Tanacetum cinerariifolium]
MLKSLISNKEKLQELANIPLNENCSTVILKKSPEKLGDPEKFLIPCGFNELKCKALADLGVVGLSQWVEKMESVFHISGCTIENQVKGNDVGGYTQRFQEFALMYTKFISNEIEKVDKYISGLPDNIHGNVMAARPKTLNDAIELANDLMDQKLRTYAKRQAENKRKPYALGTGEKKSYG